MRLFRHAGLEEPAPYLIRGHPVGRPDESQEPCQRLGPGFHREPWIPAFALNRAWFRAFAGMTTFMKTVVYGQTLINANILIYFTPHPPLPLKGGGLGRGK